MLRQEQAEVRNSGVGGGFLNPFPAAHPPADF